MGEPISFQEQEATTSTVTVVESDEQVSKHSITHVHQYIKRLHDTLIVHLTMFRLCRCILHAASDKNKNLSYKQLVHTSQVVENFPLNGIRVIDLTRIVAGPYCTMILGDLGAEIIKIERPGTGDESRKWGPPFVKGTKETCYFLSLNRNKKSLCVDLKSEHGRDLIYDIAKKSDVLVENYVPGKLSGFGLGYEDIAQVAPHLIYCSITGFGSEGPYKNKPGYDLIATSVGGLLHVTGTQDGEPVRVGVAVTDMTTGLYAHGAIMAALITRAKTGKGQKIDCNLLSSQIASLINIGSNYLNCGVEARKWGSATESIVPYQAFPVKDGYFTIGVGSNEHFKDFCERIGHPELSSDEKYITNDKRVLNRKELVSFLKEKLKTKTKQELSSIFQGCSFPFAPVNSLKEAFEDPHVKEIGLVKSVNHPVAGEIKIVGPAVSFSESSNDIRSPPPTLGQHTDEILTDMLGYERGKIMELREAKIIQ